MSNPLVAEPENEDVGPDNWEGAGVASSWADLNDAVSADHVDPFEVAISAAAAGLDTLGAALNPFDALVEAGIGWVIEHVAFLHETLDALAGDPTQIVAQAQTWHNVATEIGRVAADHRAQAVAVDAWEGAAGDAYREAVRALTAALDSTAADAGQLSTLILATGAGVGTVRALVRDAIVEFLSTVLQYILGATALAFLTAGGSLGFLVTAVVIEASQLGRDIARRVSDLLDALEAAGGTAGQLGDAMRDTAAQVRAAAPGVRAAGVAADDALEEILPDRLLESGKQLSGAAQEQREWSAALAG
jgi:hypothetical protein